MGAGLGIASAVVGGISSIGNMISQAVQNKKNREFQEKMYDKQKDDNIDFWRMQNEYNTPYNQIQRYKEAGLNPALMYEGATAGNAGAITSPSKPDYHPSNVDVDLSRGLENYISTKQAQVQLQNAERQGQLIEANTAKTLRETDLMETRERQMISGIDLTQFQLDKGKQMLPYDLSRANLEVDNIRKQTQISMNREERDAMKFGYTLEQMLLNQKNTKLRNEYLSTTNSGQKIRNAISEIELKMARQGIFKGDPLYYRFGKELYEQLIDEFKEVPASIKKESKRYDKARDGGFNNMHQLLNDLWFNK